MQPHVAPSSQPDQITERWLSIAGYEGIYEVSSFGRVQSLDRNDSIGRPRYSRFLSPAMSNGYPFVQLCKQKIQRVFRIHSLVAAAFLGKRPEGYTVNHIDGNKSNNHVRNLEYLTQKDNVLHAVRTEIKGKVTNQQIWRIREAFSANPCLAVDSFASEYGVSASHIRSILRLESYAAVPNRDGSQPHSIRKLRALDAEDVCALHESGLSLNAIARKFGVNVSSVSRAYHKVVNSRVIDYDPGIVLP